MKEKKAQIVRTFRTARGWTQTRLAEFLGVSLSVVGKWERGEREPSSGVVLSIFLASGTRAPDDALTDPESFRSFLSSRLSNHTQ